MRGAGAGPGGPPGGLAGCDPERGHDESASVRPGLVPVRRRSPDSVDVCSKRFGRGRSRGTLRPGEKVFLVH
ncbi:hypothetical protein C3492_43340 [Streptomyces sp. Ru62]|nr:hypothetical protein C3492_43340 [Streptomyces sp. Ru62]